MVPSTSKFVSILLFFLHFYTFMIVTYYLVIVLLTLTLEDFWKIGEALCERRWWDVSPPHLTRRSGDCHKLLQWGLSLAENGFGAFWPWNMARLTLALSWFWSEILSHANSYDLQLVARGTCFLMPTIYLTSLSWIPDIFFGGGAIFFLGASKIPAKDAWINAHLSVSFRLVTY